MNDKQLDKLFLVFIELEDNIQNNGFSSKDIHRLKRLYIRLWMLIKDLEQEMEND